MNLQRNPIPADTSRRLFGHGFDRVKKSRILRAVVHFHSQLNLRSMDDILGASGIINLKSYQFRLLPDQNYQEIKPIRDTLNDNGIIDVVVS